jgi:cyclic pyranopterin phosphate synthase
MPPEGIRCMSMQEILTYEEIERLCRIFSQLGIKKLKVTGGEPFVRKGVCSLIARLKQLPGIDSVTLTTNGIATLPWLETLKGIGIDGINFSLDTLNPDTFYRLSGTHQSEQPLQAVQKALSLGIPNIKINCVPVSGINEAEAPALAALARDYPVHVRFIEMMPIGSGRQFQTVSEASVKAQLEAAYGPLQPLSGHFGNGPARYYHIEGFQGHIGFISAMSHKFCDTCNRIRLTADGHLKTCLFFDKGIDLKDYLRNGYSDDAIAEQIAAVIIEKPKHHDLDNEIPEPKGMSQIGG